MIDSFVIPDITFLGEQDGPAERRLKEALAVVLGLNPTVTRAYLARVRHDGRSDGVMLGLLTTNEQNNEKLAGQVGRTFAALFNAKSNLDIIFLNAEQDREIRKVCPAFYQRK
jgi:SseB protein C-terminal domain